MPRAKSTTSAPLEPLLSMQDVSDLLGIPRNTLYMWRTKGYGPLGFTVGNHVKYRPADVRNWINQQAADAS